jgi:hypothetical protein
MQSTNSPVQDAADLISRYGEAAHAIARERVERVKAQTDEKAVAHWSEVLLIVQSVQGIRS